jgi:hypothetical protein
MPSVEAVLGPRRTAGAGCSDLLDEMELQAVAVKTARAAAEIRTERMTPPVDGAR